MVRIVLLINEDAVFEHVTENNRVLISHTRSAVFNDFHTRFCAFFVTKFVTYLCLTVFIIVIK